VGNNPSNLAGWEAAQHRATKKSFELIKKSLTCEDGKGRTASIKLSPLFCTVGVSIPPESNLPELTTRDAIIKVIAF
jgi:hypothetical protein